MEEEYEMKHRVLRTLVLSLWIAAVACSLGAQSISGYEALIQQGKVQLQAGHAG